MDPGSLVAVALTFSRREANPSQSLRQAHARAGHRASRPTRRRGPPRYCECVAQVDPLAINHNTAALLGRLLDLVESGELTATSSQAKRLLRRIEGAIAALDPKPPT